MVLRAAIDTWGSTAAERAAAYPCDDLIALPDLVLYRAIDVAAPAATVFRWLCQLRVAPYSYDWIDNLGRRSPRHLTPGLEHLAAGQRMMTFFHLAGFIPGESITVDSTAGLFGRVAVTYRVTAVPCAAGQPARSRLVAKVLVAQTRGPHGWLVRRVLPAGDLVMMRKQLRNIAALAARDAGRQPVTR